MVAREAMATKIIAVLKKKMSLLFLVLSFKPRMALLYHVVFSIESRMIVNEIMDEILAFAGKICNIGLGVFDGATS